MTQMLIMLWFLILLTESILVRTMVESWGRFWICPRPRLILSPDRQKASKGSSLCLGEDFESLALGSGFENENFLTEIKYYESKIYTW